MLNVRIVCVGKIKDSFNKDGINEYLKRLSKYAKIEVIEVDDGKIKDKTMEISVYALHFSFKFVEL